MRYIYKLSALMLVVVMAASCGELFELDYQDNPNAVTPDLAGPDFVFNSIQLNTVGVFLGMHNQTAGLVRYADMGSFTYVEDLPATNTNGIWNDAYAGVFPDVQAFERLATEDGAIKGAFEADVAISRIMQAYVLIGLVDMFGDIPWSEALQGTDIISPNVDSGADVYGVAETMLDDAIATLRATSDVGGPSIDQFYGGDKDSWIYAANTMKLKIAMNMRLKDPGKLTNTLSAIGEDFINDPSRDMIFRASTERNLPNSRHPFYNNAYEANDGTYMGNYFMWLMAEEKDSIRDPRIRYYFYRQTDDSRGQDVNVYSCILSDLPDPAETPPYYTDVDENMPYCVASDDGYYGRDHGNGSGIPPDGPIRTVYGLYPGGGKWDNNSYEFTQNNGVDGALGEGIALLFSSSMSHMWLAEAAADGDFSGDALDLMKTGIEHNFERVREFEGKIPQSDLDYVIGTVVGTGEPIPASTLLPADSTFTEYIAEVEKRYNASDDKLDVVMKESYLCGYGTGYEYYNAYRRTGRPLNFQPGIDQAIGAFPRSFLYPAENVNLNSSVDQKPDLQQLVFWDDGSAVLR